MQTRELHLDTRGRELVDLTPDIRAFCEEVGGDGLCNVFVPHATAGLVVIETGAGSEEDLVELVERLLPRDRPYQHHHGSRGHGADHLTPGIFSPSLVLPVAGGLPLLGTWQHVVLLDRNPDNPDRQVLLSMLTS